MKEKVIFTMGVLDSVISHHLLIENISASGTDMVRCCVNTATEEEHLAAIEKVKDIYRVSTGNSLKILLDVCIPKDKNRVFVDSDLQIHVGDLILLTKSGSTVSVNASFRIETDANLKEYTKGEEFVLGDDAIRLKMIERLDENTLLCEAIIHDGIVSHKMGISSQRGCFKFTEEEIYNKCLALISKIRPEVVAVSEIESADDIFRIKKAISREKYHPLIMSKIETHAGIININEIISASDSMMFARGCMGVNGGVENMFLAEKRDMKECKNMHIDAYVASNLLKSLGKADAPSRAEVIDLAVLLNMGVTGLIVTDKFSRTPKGITFLNYLDRISSAVSNPLY